jgi:hypothetical protein
MYHSPCAGIEYKPKVIITPKRASRHQAMRALNSSGVSLVGAGICAGSTVTPEAFSS